MRTSRSRHALVLALSCALAAPACIGDDDGSLLDEESLSETASDLLVSSWSAPTAAGAGYFGGQVATLGSTTYMVKSGYCGAWSCGGAGESKELYWSKRTATGWTTAVRIPGQGASNTVSLAAFNGFLYMVHTGSDDNATNLWLSRFNPATETWSTNYQLAFQSFSGPPALVPYNGKLYFIGTTPGSYQMWMATMTTGEVFSASTAIPNHRSASRPSAALYDGKLYVAHRYGETGEVVISNFDGATWTAPQYILAGPLQTPIQSVAPSIASVNGYLHLVHRSLSSNAIWWTYYDGCRWPAEVSLGTLTSTRNPMLAAGSPGLVLATTSDVTWNNIVESRAIRTSLFTAPPPRVTLPGCGIIIK